MPLLLPWQRENGMMRPVFDQAAAKLSLELSATAYDFSLEDWRDAGWRDFSFQLDGTLHTGPDEMINGATGLSQTVNGYLQKIMQSKFVQGNPIHRFWGVLQKHEAEDDRCKYIVMIHPAPARRYVVAIGFMGTGKRIIDWYANFRLQERDGMHQGFLRLAEDFLSRCGEIQFAQTARELGLPSLTLLDILEE